jgi:hypothetical protein
MRGKLSLAFVLLLAAAGVAAAAKTAVTPVWLAFRVDVVATDAAGHTTLVARTSVRIGH